MLQNTEGPAAIGHVISTSPSFDTHLSMNAGRLTCVLGFTGPHKQSQLDSWRQPGPNGGSGLLFNILPSEPCRQSTVHFESPSVRLKEHRQWKKLSKKCSAILQLVFSPEALWMKALNECKSPERTWWFRRSLCFLTTLRFRSQEQNKVTVCIVLAVTH